MAASSSASLVSSDDLNDSNPQFSFDDRVVKALESVVSGQVSPILDRLTSLELKTSGTVTVQPDTGPAGNLRSKNPGSKIGDLDLAEEEDGDDPDFEPGSGANDDAGSGDDPPPSDSDKEDKSSEGLRKGGEKDDLLSDDEEEDYEPDDGPWDDPPGDDSSDDEKPSKKKSPRVFSRAWASGQRVRLLDDSIFTLPSHLATTAFFSVRDANHRQCFEGVSVGRKEEANHLYQVCAFLLNRCNQLASVLARQQQGRRPLPRATFSQLVHLWQQLYATFELSATRYQILVDLSGDAQAQAQGAILGTIASPSSAISALGKSVEQSFVSARTRVQTKGAAEKTQSGTRGGRRGGGRGGSSSNRSNNNKSNNNGSKSNGNDNSQTS